MKLQSPIVSFPRSEESVDLESAIKFYSKDFNNNDNAELKRWHALALICDGNNEDGLKILESIDVSEIPSLDPVLHQAYILLIKVNSELDSDINEKSLSIALKLLELLKDYKHSKSANYLAIVANLLYNLAYIHNKKGVYDAAEKELEKAQKIYSKLAKKDGKRFGEALLTAVAASTVIYKSRIKKHNILAHYQAATYNLVSSIGKDSTTILELVDYLIKEGDLLLEIGNYKEAAKNYTRALDYLRKISKQMDIRHLRVSIKLARAFTYIDKKRDSGYILLNTLKMFADKLNANKELDEIIQLIGMRQKNEVMTRLSKLVTILIILFCSMSVNAQLIMGHRGSIWGVENTRTAFINGAKHGYNGLECDIKVTKDGRFVISHDDKLSRLNPDSIDITKRNFNYLLNVPLTQTRRDGIYYEGKLCSLEEYLDICKEYNVIPLIEIKWCANIYSNNSNPEQYKYEGIPALLNIIKSKDLEDKAILMTSMRGVLSEIRKQNKIISLQCLTANKWEHLVDFCVTNKCDIDVRNDANMNNLVETFHKKGLKVNIWCLDQPQDIKKFGDMGIDYITTNSYQPNIQYK